MIEITFESTLNAWREFRAGTIASTEEVATLISAAQTAQNTPAWMWADMTSELQEHGGFKTPRDAEKEVRRCQVIADLGMEPHIAQEFIPLFMESRDITMGYSGTFKMRGTERSLGYILNEMLLWVDNMKCLTRKGIEAALPNWIETEKERQRQAAYENIAYVPQSDPMHTELARLVALMIPGSEEDDFKLRRATKIVLANFVHRTKNHMRAKWTHATHLMPILFGDQGCGKTTLVQHLISPLREFAMEVGFELFSDNSKMYQLAEMPLMVFDEMAGIGKADVELLKGIMTTPSRQLREAYARATTRTVISTFLGCSNRDIRTMIRDETGNRRFLQIDVGRMSRDDIFAIDVLKIWRSVDENAVSPLHDSPDGLDAVQDVQAGQRFRSPIEIWLDDAEEIRSFRRASALFSDLFKPWLLNHFPGEERYTNAQRFGIELAGLVKSGRTDRLEIKANPKGNTYRILTAPNGGDEGDDEEVRPIIKLIKGLQ